MERKARIQKRGMTVGTDQSPSHFTITQIQENGLSNFNRALRRPALEPGWRAHK